MVLPHSDSMLHPTELGLGENRFNTDGASKFLDIRVDDVILPPESVDGTKNPHVKVFYFLDVLPLQEL